MAYPNRAIVDTVRTVAFGALTANFGAVGVALASPARVFILNNNTNQPLEVSLDGVNVNFFLPSRAFKLIDVTTNKVRDDGFFVREGTIFYARHTGVAPTSGGIYVEVIRS